MSVLRITFLIFAVIGALQAFLLPSPIDGSAFQAPALSLSKWVTGGDAAAIVTDVMIAAIVLTIWGLAEVYVRKNWTALIGVAAAWAIGLGCGLPLYLYLRSAPPR